MIADNKFSEQFTADMPSSDVMYSNSLKLARFNKRMDDHVAVQFERNEQWRKEIEAYHKVLEDNARNNGRSDVYEAIKEWWVHRELYKFDTTPNDFIQSLKLIIATKDNQ